MSRICDSTKAQVKGPFQVRHHLVQGADPGDVDLVHSPPPTVEAQPADQHQAAERLCINHVAGRQHGHSDGQGEAISPCQTASQSQSGHARAYHPFRVEVGGRFVTVPELGNIRVPGGFHMRRIITALLIAVLGFGVSGCELPEEGDDSTYAEKKAKERAEKAEDEVKKAKTEAKANVPKPEPEPDPEPDLTSGQENALASAEDYLGYSAFSKEGLIEQLTFEDYSKKDAEFAANNVDANWMQQAVASAEDYLSYTSFSRQGLIEQLEFSRGFSSEAGTARGQRRAALTQGECLGLGLGPVQQELKPGCALLAVNRLWADSLRSASHPGEDRTKRYGEQCH